MHHARGVRRGQRFGDIDRDIEQLSAGHAAGRHQFTQRAPRYVLQDDEVLALRFFELINGCNAGMR